MRTTDSAGTFASSSRTLELCGESLLTTSWVVPHESLIEKNETEFDIFLVADG